MTASFRRPRVLVYLSLLIPASGFFQSKTPKLPLHAETPPPPQVIRFRDAVSKQSISIVGTIHYNPVSIRRAEEEVSAIKPQSVVIESCESRWLRTLEITEDEQGAEVETRKESTLFASEMQSAANAARDLNVPVNLGDVDVGTFVPRVKSLLKETLIDLLSPQNGGWSRVSTDIQRGYRDAFDVTEMLQNELNYGNKAFGFKDLARFDVLSGMALSLIRYPAAFAIKAPKEFLVFVTGLLALENVLDAAEAFAFDSVGAAASDVTVTHSGLQSFEVGVVSVGILLVELLPSVIVARVLLKAFLEERNAKLARSIRAVAVDQKGPVVAILGGLHVNGVAKLLMKEEVPMADGSDEVGVWWAESVSERVKRGTKIRSVDQTTKTIT